MKLSESIKKFFKDWKQTKTDKKNIELWKADIKHEAAKLDSKFNAFGLTLDDSLMTITAIVTLPEAYQFSNNDALKYAKLKEDVMPINIYLARDLNWGEYINKPEFYYVEEDVSDDNLNDSTNEKENVLTGVSCTYLAIWRFKPLVKKDANYIMKHIAFYGIDALILASLGALIFFLL